MQSAGKIFAALLFVVAAVGSQPSWPAFSSPVSMGTSNTQPNVSCGQASIGSVACVARASDSTLLVNRYSGSAWSGWSPLTINGSTVKTVFTSDPSCAGDGRGHVFCGIRGSGGALEIATFDGAAWNLQMLVSSLTSSPSCVSYAVGKILCAGRGATSGLAWTAYDGASWRAIGEVTATLATGVSCASDDLGNAVCAALNAQHHVAVARFNGFTWDSFIDIGGVGSGQPNCAGMGSGDTKVMCTVRGTDTRMYASLFNGGSWSAPSWGAWKSMGNTFVGQDSSCVNYGASRLLCATLGTTSIVMTNQYDVTAFGGWSGWTLRGGAWQGGVRCGALGSGQVMCTVVDMAHRAWSIVGP